MKVLFECRLCGIRKAIGTAASRSEAQNLMQQALLNYGFTNCLGYKLKGVKRKFDDGSFETVFNFGVDNKCFVVKA
jgi:hypothetical protein